MAEEGRQDHRRRADRDQPVRAYLHLRASVHASSTGKRTCGPPTPSSSGAWRRYERTTPFRAGTRDPGRPARLPDHDLRARRPDARLALADFLGDREHGIFKGPFLRLRLPFRAAADGWQSILGWDIGLTPYGHQAEAFARLSTADLGPDKPRPLPTLVTTGTGSGKTEAFLYPILDHVLRARRDGVTGMKALILYPMNALANDQAKRLADLLTTRDELAGITAALYTGQDGPQRTKVSADGLITDRAIIRDAAPDILLTNYKMLDQLLLRYEDKAIWQQSARSLQYLVLDEFHTYDGAQGTDVAMLLRRLGLTLKSYLPDDALTDAERARPLGRVTPVATSATLGDQGDPAEMIGFARTVFGDDFDETSVVTESRLDLAEWTAGAADRVAALGLTPRRPVRADLASANAAVAELPRTDAPGRTFALLGALYDTAPDTLAGKIGDDAELLLALVRAHPLVREIVPGGGAGRPPERPRRGFVSRAGERSGHRRRGRADHVPHPPGRGAQPCPGRRRACRALRRPASVGA